MSHVKNETGHQLKELYSWRTLIHDISWAEQGTICKPEWEKGHWSSIEWKKKKMTQFWNHLGLSIPITNRLKRVQWLKYRTVRCLFAFGFVCMVGLSVWVCVHVFVGEHSEIIQGNFRLVQRFRLCHLQRGFQGRLRYEHLASWSKKHGGLWWEM